MTPTSSKTASRKAFEPGEVYYSVYFVDEDMKYPFVGCYVFIGENVRGSEREPTWYFQDCESFAKVGSFLNGMAGDREILGLTQDAIQNVVILDQMLIELQGAAARREEFGSGPSR